MDDGELGIGMGSVKKRGGKIRFIEVSFSRSLVEEPDLFFFSLRGGYYWVGGVRYRWIGT